MMRVIFAALLLFAYLFSLYLYGSSLDFYFFQDDFFEMDYAKANNLKEYFNFFNFRSDIVDWRPISQLNYFFFLQKIFGLNPVGYRLTVFILFFITALIISKLISKISRSVETGVLTASLWLTSSVHFMNLTWISASYNIIGTFFFTLASLLFIIHLKTKNQFYYFVTLLTFTLALGSFEFALVWPVLFVLYFTFVLNNSVKTTIKKFTPFILIVFIYLAARFLFMNVPKIPEYQVAANIDSIKALFWYVLWSFNIPEEFKKQVVDNLLIFNNKFLEDFFPIVVKTFWGALAVLTLAIISPLVILIRRKENQDWRLLIFFIFWFFVTISPVLLIPNHTFIMYLTLASIGIYGAIAYLLTATQKIFLVLAVIVIWIWTSAVTLTFYKHNFWMIEAQKTAREFAVNIKKQFPAFPEGSVVLYPLQGQFRKQALLENHAIITLYNDPTLLIYYNEEDLISDYQKIKQKPIYIYLPE